MYARHWDLVRQFRRKFRRLPRPGFPTTYGDCFLWRKVFDRDPRFVRVSDKLEVKEFVRERLGDAMKMPRTLWVGGRPEDIPDELLKGNVAVKANHSWETVTLVLNGNVDRAQLERDARGWLAKRHWEQDAEWSYSKITPRLFVEELLVVNGRPVQMELKFLVFGGRVRYCMMVTGRGTDPRSEVFDRDGSHTGSHGKYGLPDRLSVAPPVFAQARDLAERICADFDFMRCDLYVVDDTVYLGELTVYPSAGMFEYYGDITLGLNAAWDVTLSAFVSGAHGGLRGLYAWALRVLVA